MNLLLNVRCVAFFGTLYACSLMAGNGSAQVNIIFDSDFAPDVDDVGSLALLHALADNGEVNILGAAVSSTHKWSPGAIDAVNTFHGRPDIPISINKNPAFDRPGGSGYASALANGNYGNDIFDDNDVPDAVSMYREILASAPDNSVTIVTVGFMTNMSDLLDSGPDAFSPLSGSDLIAQKVDQLVTMGGRYPNGGEFNFNNGGNAAPNGVGPYAQNAVNNWPTRAVFSGAEIGSQIKTGAALFDPSIPTYNPIREAYGIYVGPGNDRSSWDQTAVLYAARGTTFGGENYWSLEEEGSNLVQNNGSNAWQAMPDKDQAYIQNNFNLSQMEGVIEGLMTQEPIGGWPDAPQIDPYDPVGTLLHYNFSAGSGTQAIDLSGQGNHGMLVGFANTTAQAGSFNSSEGWVEGGGLSFIDDGVRSYVETPVALDTLFDPDGTHNKDFTIEFIANYAGSANWTPVIGSNHGPDFDAAEAFFLGIHTDLADLEVRTPSGGGGAVGEDENPWTAPDETEYHIAMTYDRLTNQVEVFIDGISIGTKSSAGINMDSEALFRIGNVGWSSAEQWGGVINAVAISDLRLAPESFVLGLDTSGDFDGDGDVDGADFLEWQRVDGSAAGLQAWRTSFGTLGATSASVAVPEPATWLLLPAALVVLLSLGRARMTKPE